MAGDAEREARIAAALADQPSTDLVMRCVDRAEALGCIRGASLDVLLAVGPVNWFDYQCAEETRRHGIRLLGYAADPIEAEMLETTGFRVIPEDSSLAEVASPAEAVAVLRPGTPPGKLIAVWGAKGAPGRTTVAIELASTLASAEPATLLVDADLYGGDVLQMLGIVEELPGVVAVARSAARGELRDPSWIDQLRRADASGPILLAGLLRADMWSEVSPFGWQELLDVVRRRFRYAVCDVGFCLEPSPNPAVSGGRNEVARTTVAAADEVVAVLRADPVGLRSFLWALESEGDLLVADKLRVVVNRVRPGQEREVRMLVRRHVGHFPVAMIPDRPDHIARAQWSGQPLAASQPGSPVAEEVRTLAAAVGLRMPPRGFLSRLSGRSVHV